MICENVISYFPARVYNRIEDLGETFMNTANCHSARITVAVKIILISVKAILFIFIQIL